MDTDYHYEKTRKILDDYYNKKNEIKDEESESLKEKFDHSKSRHIPTSNQNRNFSFNFHLI